MNRRPLVVSECSRVESSLLDEERGLHTGWFKKGPRFVHLSLPVSCFVVFCFIEQEFRSGGDRRSLLIWSITTMSARHDTTGLFKTFRDPAGSVK